MCHSVMVRKYGKVSVGCERFNMKVVNMTMPSPAVVHVARVIVKQWAYLSALLDQHALKLMLKISRNVVSYIQDEQSLSFDLSIGWTYA